MLTTGEEVSLYFHLPFCQKKCPYCHFYVQPYHEESISLFFEGLKREWDQKKHLLLGKKIVSIYFGGGTPSLVPIRYLESLFEYLPITSDMEITFEANPEDVSEENAKGWKKLGINRMSVGVQTLTPSLLQFLGRIHSSEKAIKAVQTLADVGFSNISIDLMFELPSQRFSDMKSTLDIVTNLPISHLSLYNLCYEEGSVYYKKQDELSLLQPPDSEGLQMLNYAEESLENAGLKRYEISAFAREGFESIHNLGYWRGTPFLGFGPSAFGEWDGSRKRNIAHLRKWLKALEKSEVAIDFEETLPTAEKERERLAIGLRVFSGYKIKNQSKEIESVLSDLIDKGWVKKENEIAYLTHEGRLFYDSVAEYIV